MKNNLATKIRAEFDRLRRVAIHRPGIEMFFGLLAPEASLYERVFNRYGARMEHERLEYTLRHEFGIEVFRIKERLLELADKKPEVREKLVAAGLNDLKFTGDEKAVAEARKEVQEGSAMYDGGHFFNLLLLHPTLDLEKGGRGRQGNSSGCHRKRSPCKPLLHERPAGCN